MRAYQHGNVVIFILLAVGLFGALAYSFTRNSQQSQGNMTEQQAKVTAQEILNYARSVEQAVNKLRQRGCSQSQLSFDYDIPGTTGYENVTAPGTEECHVFSPSGGGIPWSAPNETWLIPQASATTMTNAGVDYALYKFSNNVCVANVGPTTCDSTRASKDLIFGLEYLQTDVCRELNNLLGQTYNTTAVNCSIAGDNTGKFVGSFYGAGQFLCPSMNGLRVGCINSTRAGNTFFHILLEQ
jgi:hypothetical protein